MVRRRGALAKLSPPRLHDVLARTRLYSQLDAACARQVVWLTAQPGAGKTTLVAGYLEARKRPGIWYQVDDADADPSSFIYHLRLAAEPYCKTDAPNPLPLLTPEYLRDLRGFARRFFREVFNLLGADAALVFDNLHEVAESSELHVLIGEALGQVPEGITVFVLSRAEPPAPYAPLLAHDAMTLVDGAALRLTLAETRAIARKRGVLADAAIETLQARSHGWAAGLTLLLMGVQRQGSGDEFDADSLQHVFGYFAQRVFDGASAEEQRALVQLAVLPLITVDLAAKLTGMESAGRLLEHYYRRRMFTDRRRVAGAAQAAYVFQFHDLFRSFLLHHARTTFSARELRDVERRAGLLLEAAGHWEHAFPLLADAGEWDACCRLFTTHAEDLLAQGRQQTIAELLGRLPGAARAREPWLGYWEGRALMQNDPDRARRALQSAFQRFATRSDAAGQIACSAAVIQSLWYARLGWSEIDPWVKRMEPLLGEHAEFPSRAVELLTYSAFHAALAFCRLTHPAIRAVAPRLVALVDDPAIDWNQRLSTATHLITYLHNAAEHELGAQLIAKVDTAVETQAASALNRAFWFVFRAIYDLRQAKYDEASQRFQRAEDLAREDGLAHAEFAALQFRAYLDVLFRRADAAQARVARMEVHPARGNPDAEMNYHFVQTLLAQLRGDVRAAHAHAARALEAINAVNAAYFQAVYAAMMASAFADAGDPARALQIVAGARTVARGSYLEVMEAQLLLEEAYIALTLGDADTARARLAQGLRLAAGNRSCAAYAHRIAVRKPVLLSLALQAGIEAGFVRTMIRNWRIPPPADAAAHWPWPIEVRTLGGFELRVDGAAVGFGRKTPKKTLALLKALVARGGSAPEAALIDAFWSDEEGDAAARSLAATVQRLRTLLGDGDAVIQQGKQLALDRTRVWADAWAFERALGAARGEEALALYRGAFLPDDEGESWPVATRERLRSKFVQAVAEQGARLEAAQRDEEAVAWYLRGLDADSVVEPFYQGLMRCYRRLDRLPAAISAYLRLKKALAATLGVAPSAQTEKIFQTLRPG